MQASGTSAGRAVSASCTLSFARSTCQGLTGSDCASQRDFPSSETDGVAMSFIDAMAHTPGAEQYLHAAAAIAEGHLQKQQELPALNQQRHARDWQQQDAKPAVEHVVRARGEARELLAEKCPIDAPALDGLFAVHSLARCARRSRDLQKAAREQRPRQRKQREDDRRAQQHRCHIARTGQAKDVERVRRALDLLTVDRGVGDERSMAVCALKTKK